MNASAAPFANLVHGAAQHFRLALFGAVARVIEQFGEELGGDEPSAWLAEYGTEMQALLGSAPLTAARWQQAVQRWAARSEEPLPLRAWARSGMDPLHLELLLAAGLLEEDPRFGDLFEAAQGHARRPCLALLQAWWRRAPDGSDRVEAVRQALLDLLRDGLLQVSNPEAPRPDWLLAVPHALWDALRGDVPTLPWLSHQPRAMLMPLDGYIAAAEMQARLRALPALLVQQPQQLVLLRGPAHNGRRCLAGALAHALGLSLLVAGPEVFDEAPRWRLFITLAVLLDALPVVLADLAPGQARELPVLPGALGPLVVVGSSHGAWTSACGRPILNIELPLPLQAERERHWQAVLPQLPAGQRQALAAQARLASGHLRRAAGSACTLARLEGRDAPGLADLQQACRALQAARLETLARRLPAQGGLHELATDEATRDELQTLAARCRHREQLAAGSPLLAQPNCGVRALFAGASGTGKTLAARLLAATLGKELFRIDLAATVNKYIGETEKNLERAFAAAEELDAVLLLDEGDALMAKRTEVGSANDRYANLETNYLLQRIESYGGILLVTSNAAERIDTAFQRRMDVVIQFRAPDEAQRHRILALHLDTAAIPDDLLQDIAARCALSGGQLCNLAQHARLLAIEQGQQLHAGHLEAALLREYRKIGTHCPVRLSGQRDLRVQTAW